ncbi:zinc-ribbon domain-containing protein [Vulgatibacter incomptus]|uniref:MJ0042 family finger-like protein n=1 Tax=Vulgatibacter incomptus TaxID=1391653 RepID=A0A0K1P9J7_9BACT|nr:zinc-ribbon domain-containing protein [Vulgatibacter incomptus]AKU90187.1 MJ0042 family finger-like protein [Vulgatibacter incomptus]
MIVTCTKCKSRYRFPADKVSKAGVRARCSRCSAVVVVLPDGRTEADPSPALAKHAAPAGPVHQPPPPPPPPPPLPSQTELPPEIPGEVAGPWMDAGLPEPAPQRAGSWREIELDAGDPEPAPAFGGSWSEVEMAAGLPVPAVPAPDVAPEEDPFSLLATGPEESPWEGFSFEEAPRSPAAPEPAVVPEEAPFASMPPIAAAPPPSATIRRPSDAAAKREPRRHEAKAWGWLQAIAFAGLLALAVVAGLGILSPGLGVDAGHDPVEVVADSLAMGLYPSASADGANRVYVVGLVRFDGERPAGKRVHVEAELRDRAGRTFAKAEGWAGGAAEQNAEAGDPAPALLESLPNGDDRFVVVFPTSSVPSGPIRARAVATLVDAAELPRVGDL